MKIILVTDVVDYFSRTFFLAPPPQSNGFVILNQMREGRKDIGDPLFFILPIGKLLWNNQILCLFFAVNLPMEMVKLEPVIYNR